MPQSEIGYNGLNISKFNTWKSSTMSEKSSVNIEVKNLAKEEWSTIFRVYSAVVAPFIVGGIIFVIVAAIVGFSSEALIKSYEDEISKFVLDSGSNQIITYLVSWVLLILISVAAFSQISEIIEHRENDKLRKKPNQIAVIIGLVMTIFLFKQPFLNDLFEGSNITVLIEIILFGGAAAAGWYAWFLKQVKKYGEFFHVFLLTAVIGFCWYAKLTAPEAVQLVAVAFLLGSLLRIAKDYLDEAESQSD